MPMILIDCCGWVKIPDRSLLGGIIIQKSPDVFPFKKRQGFSVFMNRDSCYRINAR